MRNKLILALLLLPLALPLSAQKISKNLEFELTDTLSDAYLDSLVIDKKGSINDYSLIGVQYGVALSRVFWNPTQKQDMVFIPFNLGVTYTRYGKMFGYMPYFGFQTGLFLGREGYRFKYNKDKDYTYTVEGAESALIDMVELPVLAHMHLDFWKMKVMINLGCYAGYRLKIQRFPGNNGYVKPELESAFKDTDRRVDYGIKGGIGFGLIFDPVEIHIQGMYKHSLSSLYEPDYASKDYYRFAYPSNIIISVGLHFQITKRTGMTRNQLKKLAKESVYENE